MSLPGRFVETFAGRVFVHRPRPDAGPPLVVVHGFMASHFLFRPILPPLVESHDVIALDLPGFGESDRPAPAAFAYDAPAFARVLDEVLGRLGVPRAAVLGHSMGGGASLALAARHPARVERLILVCPTVYPLPRPPEARLLLSSLGPFLWKHVMSKRDVARTWRGRHVREPRSVSDELVDYSWARLNRAGGREAGYAALVALSKLTDGNADPGRVRAPTLLVWPEEDRVVPLPLGKRLQRAIPGAELRVVPAAGHDVFLDRPDELVRTLRPFLDRAAATVDVVPTAPVERVAVEQPDARAAAERLKRSVS